MRPRKGGAPGRRIWMYLDGQLIISFVDPYGRDLAGQVWIMKDDMTSGGGEASSGMLYSVRVYSGALGQSDVAGLQ